jgi:hypothetical protein
MNSVPENDLELHLETTLNQFPTAERRQALAQLAGLAEKGQLQLECEKEAANMHCHTFYSFNAYGYSPAGLAWMAKKSGLPLLGIVDFDVLDGVDEFIDACFSLGVRGSAALETRVYIPEFATREINSPGEPGVYYYMGIGFSTGQAPATAAPILADMRRRAEQRNLAMVERINAYLSPVEIDYQRDVLPLTPADNATERHLLAAYTKAAARYFADPVPFWAEKLKLPAEQVAAQISDGPTFQNTVRAKLMKRGGVGYAQPGAGTFPTLKDVSQMIIACQALPCATWLDGTTAGEQAMPELLDLLISQGVAALNIVPDRNWNIADPEVRKVKLNHLYQVVELAQKFDLPLNIGTEMNAYGQKRVDDFDRPELAPVRQAFMDGAYFIYGHTVMQRALSLGYQSEWANAHLPTRRERNTFYTRIGRLVPPTAAGVARLQQVRQTAKTTPDDFLTV